MRLVLNVIMFAVAMAVVSVFALRMANVFKPVEVKQGLMDKASDLFQDSYTSAEVFVLDARYELKHNKYIKELETKAREVREKISLEHSPAADDLKKITPDAFQETFK